MNTKNPQTRCGTVAIVGLTNAGKSTLVNRLVGKMVSIVHHKVQTTRNVVRGIITQGNHQAVLVDLPGMHTVHLPRQGQRGIDRQLQQTDSVVAVVDACALSQPEQAQKRWPYLQALAQRLQGLPPNTRWILALNKVDQVFPKEQLLTVAEQVARLLSGAALPSGNPDDTPPPTSTALPVTFMISAKTGQGVAALRRDLLQSLPPQPWLFAQDAHSDFSDEWLATEITRKVCLDLLHQEIPYHLAVRPDNDEWPDADSAYPTKAHHPPIIRHVIVVDHPHYRASVIGHNGRMIGKIRQRAEREICRVFGKKIRLSLHVRHDSRLVIWGR